jgi:hypothetical protein
MRPAFACVFVSIFLIQIQACGAGGAQPSGNRIARLDGTTTDTTTLTARIEKLTRAANVQG